MPKLESPRFGLTSAGNVDGKVAEAARQAGRVLAVALMMRFFPHNTWLKELVEDGEIGEVQELSVEDGAPLDWPMASNSYFDRNETGGGVLFDSGVHFVDRVVWLFGDLAQIEYEDDAFGGFESNARLRGVLQIAGSPSSWFSSSSRSRLVSYSKVPPQRGQALREVLDQPAGGSGFHGGGILTEAHAGHSTCSASSSARVTPPKLVDCRR